MSQQPTLPGVRSPSDERAEVIRIGLEKLHRPPPTIEDLARRRAAQPNPKPWTYPGHPRPLFTESEIADLAKSRA